VTRLADREDDRRDEDDDNSKDHAAAGSEWTLRNGMGHVWLLFGSGRHTAATVLKNTVYPAATSAKRPQSG
jgi:hypothetical protein